MQARMQTTAMPDINPHDERHGDAPLPRLDGLSFDALLKLAQRRGGDLLAMSVPSAGATQRLTADHLAGQVSRLAGLFGQTGAVAGQNLAIFAPMGLPAAITLLAALRTGMVPFLVPADISQTALTRLLERTETEIVIGVDKIGAVQPLLMLRDAAAQIFGIRCIAGFGAAIPDGVMALDHVLASPACPMMPISAGSAPGRIGVIDADDREGAIEYLLESDVLDAGLRLVQALQIAPDTRIASTLLGAGLPALATGPAAALLAGAEFTPIGLFSLYGLESCLGDGRKVHLVAPAATAAALLKAGLGHHAAIASLVFVHLPGQPPAELALPAAADVAVVDVFSPVIGSIDIRVRLA